MANYLQTAFYSGHDAAQDKGDAMANRVKAIAEKYKVQEEIKEDEEKPSRLSRKKLSESIKKKSTRIKEEKHYGTKGKHDDHEEDTRKDTGSSEQSDDGKKKRKQKRQEDDDMKSHARQGDKDVNSRTEHITEHLAKVAFKEKVKLGVYVFFVVIFLNSCLIACFSIGQ